MNYASIDQNGHFISVNDPDPIIQQAAFEPPPKYQDMAYSTTYYLSSELERELFAVRKARGIDVPLKEVMDAICQAEGVTINTD